MYTNSPIEIRLGVLELNQERDTDKAMAVAVLVGSVSGASVYDMIRHTCTGAWATPSAQPDGSGSHGMR